MVVIDNPHFLNTQTISFHFLVLKDFYKFQVHCFCKDQCFHFQTQCLINLEYKFLETHTSAQSKYPIGTSTFSYSFLLL